MEEPLKEGFSL